jgi:hypothetical protein
MSAETVHHEEHAGAIIHVDAVFIGGPLKTRVTSNAGSPTGNGAHDDPRLFRALTAMKKITNKSKSAESGT